MSSYHPALSLLDVDLFYIKLEDYFVLTKLTHRSYRTLIFHPAPNPSSSSLHLNKDPSLANHPLFHLHLPLNTTHPPPSHPIYPRATPPLLPPLPAAPVICFVSFSASSCSPSNDNTFLSLFNELSLHHSFCWRGFRGNDGRQSRAWPDYRGRRRESRGCCRISCFEER